MTIKEKIRAERILPILRNTPIADIPKVMELLTDAGITVGEITINSPDFEASVAYIKENYPTFMIGAGTVTTLARMERVIELGLSFIVTPNTRIDVIKLAKKHGIGTIIGALTPSEVVLAAEAGADIVKLFPIDVLGVPYFNALRGPLSEYDFMPTGGVTVTNIQDYRKAGAFGYGIGSELIKPAMLKAGNYSEISEHIKLFIKLAKDDM